MRQRLLTHQQVRQVERALRRSSLEGAANGGMLGFGEQFIGAYAVALRATGLEIGLLTAAYSLASALGSSLSFRAARVLGTRKRVVLVFALLQGLMWPSLLALGWREGGHRVELLIGWVAFYAACGALTVPCWSSIASELVPSRLRGQYFGVRSRVSTLSTVAASLLAGLLFYLLRGHGLVGFAVAFLAAFGFRMVSVLLLTALLELHTAVKSEEMVPVRRFFRDLPVTNLGRAMLFVMLMSFTVNLAGPQFTPYMLRDLHFSYLSFAVLQVASAVGSILTVTHWGFAADRVGNRRMLSIAGVLVAAVPLLWLVSPNVVYLAAVNMFSGFAWAGFNLTSVNFIYDATTDKNRTAYLALFNAGAGCAAAVGATLGGVLVGHMPALLGFPALALFALSGGLRLSVGLAFLPLIREVRRVTRASALDVFHSMIAGRPAHHLAGHDRVLRLQPHSSPNGNGHNDAD